MLPSGVPRSENTELFALLPLTEATSQPADSTWHIVRLLAKRAVAAVAKTRTFGENRGGNKSTPLRPLPLHPQIMKTCGVPQDRLSVWLHVSADRLYLLYRTTEGS